MWYLFNLSLKNCKYPLYWKQACVCLEFKCDDQNEILNYRTISILPKIFKLLEKILFNRIYCFIKSKIVNQQYGFIPQRSSFTKMLNFIQYVKTYYSLGILVDAIYLDFRKAFHSANHDSLWQNYIFGDFQIGSNMCCNLGVLMFFCYVNDVAEYIKYSQILLFADDIKIFLPIDSSQSCALLQSEINAINNWCTELKLYLNFNKCSIMSITKKSVVTNYNYKINNSNLKKVLSITDLSISYDFKLQFTCHIKSIISNCSKLIDFIIHNSSSFQNINTFITLFNSLI